MKSLGRDRSDGGRVRKSSGNRENARHGKAEKDRQLNKRRGDRQIDRETVGEGTYRWMHCQREKER